jgi:hypothetical protein
VSGAQEAIAASAVIGVVVRIDESFPIAVTDVLVVMAGPAVKAGPVGRLGIGLIEVAVVLAVVDQVAIGQAVAETEGQAVFVTVAETAVARVAAILVVIAALVAAAVAVDPVAVADPVGDLAVAGPVGAAVDPVAADRVVAADQAVAVQVEEAETSYLRMTCCTPFGSATCYRNNNTP